MRDYVDEALEDLKETLAFIKTFKRTEFDTIYSEREWRSVRSFNFTFEDIYAIVLPEKNGFYQYLTKNRFLKIPKIIKIIPWEEIEV